MVTEPKNVELRESSKRPFGVYALVFILLIGVMTAVLEIFRIQSGLEGIWMSADEFLRDRSGFVALASRLFSNPAVLTLVNGLIIATWMLIIAGLWALQRWAWLSLMILTGISLALALARYFSGDPDYISMATNVAVAFYLNDRTVQRAFARREPEVIV